MCPTEIVSAPHCARQSHLTYKFLSEELYEYLDAAIMVQTSPEEAYRKVNEGVEPLDTCRSCCIFCNPVNGDSHVLFEVAQMHRAVAPRRSMGCC